MKIKIVRHYHGVLSNDKHLNVGGTYDLDDDAAKVLILRGYAQADKPPTRSSKK